MKIYKVERPNGEWGYDEYDSFVCVASSEEDARKMHPGGIDGTWATWPCSPDRLEVTEIGTASPDTAARVFLVSFNPG